MDESQLAPTGSDAYRARRLRRVFNNYREAERFVEEDIKSLEDANPPVQYLSYRLELFEDLDPWVRQFFTDTEEFQTTEIPVAACYKDSNLWLLISTMKVSWKSQGEKRQLKFWDIEKVGLSYGPCGVLIDCLDPEAISRTPPNRSIYPKKLAQIVSPWIFLVDRSEQRHEFFLDSMEKQITLKLLEFMIRLEAIHSRRSDTTQKWTSDLSNMLKMNLKYSIGRMLSKTTKTFQSRFNTTPEHMISLEWENLEKEWLDLWMQMRINEIDQRDLSPGPDLKTLKNNHELLETLLAKMGMHMQALSRIRKCVLWGIVLLEPVERKNVVREFLRVTKLVQTQSKHSRGSPDIAHLNNPVALDGQIANLESLVYEKMKNVEIVESKIPELAKLIELKSFLQMRLALIEAEQSYSESRRITALEGNDIEYFQLLERQKKISEKLAESNNAIIEIVNKAIKWRQENPISKS